MQPPQNATNGARVVILYECLFDAALAVPRGVIGLEEEPPIIAINVGFDDYNSVLQIDR